jgi:hypothetical protein
MKRKKNPQRTKKKRRKLKNNRSATTRYERASGDCRQGRGDETKEGEQEKGDRRR